jgi:Kef-type K+ transport system membrane component KefB
MPLRAQDHFSVSSPRPSIPVALGLTTTALGTLLRILRDNNILHGSLGSYVLAGNAVGEFFPIVAIAVFLGSNGRFLGLISQLVVAVIAPVLSLIRDLGGVDGCSRS